MRSSTNRTTDPVGEDIMKITSITVAVILSAGLFSACATQPAPRWFYKESQFSSRVEYLRFCQRYALHDRQCD
jgi:hypothetical protein